MRFFVESSLLVTVATITILFGYGLSSIDALLLSTASSLSTSTVSSKTIYDGLSTTPLTRASDQELVTLPSLWRANTPFGLADETAVCAFLRHYG